MLTKIAQLHLLYHQLGIEKGDRIAICGRNSSHWAIAYLSVATYGAVAVTILPDFTGESIHSLCTHSGARLLFVGSFVHSKINSQEMEGVEHCILLDDISLISSKKDGTDAIFAGLNDAFLSAYPNGVSLDDVPFPVDNLDDLALINYTSGTTSQPKGVMLSHRALSANVMFGQKNIPSKPGWRIVSMLPLAHMFGLMFEFIYQIAGGCHVYFLTKTPTPTILLRSFADVRPYMVLTVPMVIEKIVKKKILPMLQKPVVKVLWKTPIVNEIVKKKVYKGLMQAFGGELLHLIIGGAALNQEVENCLRAVRFPFTVGYGMTECGPLVGYAHWKTYKAHSCGRIVDALEMRLDRPDPKNPVGEIQLKGEHVMMGYYNNPEASASAFTEDGWLRTGDLGEVDKAGNIFIRGRNKNMILGASGQNIYPEEIEDKLNGMTGVVESVVVEREGKLVGLVFPDFELNDAMEKEGRSLKDLMNDNLQKLNNLLPAFCRLAHIEMVEKEFEKTPKRSIKRFLYK